MVFHGTKMSMKSYFSFRSMQGHPMGFAGSRPFESGRAPWPRFRHHFRAARDGPGPERIIRARNPGRGFRHGKTGVFHGKGPPFRRSPLPWVFRELCFLFSLLFPADSRFFAESRFFCGFQILWGNQTLCGFHRDAPVGAGEKDGVLERDFGLDGADGRD